MEQRGGGDSRLEGGTGSNKYGLFTGVHFPGKRVEFRKWSLMEVGDGLASPSLGLATVCLRVASGTGQAVIHQCGILAPLALHSDEQTVRSHPGDTAGRPAFSQPNIIRSSPGP